MKAEIAERLNCLNIQVVSEGDYFCVFVRDTCLAMAPCDQGEFTGVGSTGISSEQGLGYLVLRNGEYLLAGSKFEIPASAEDVQKVQRFSADLKVALGLDLT